MTQTLTKKERELIVVAMQEHFKWDEVRAMKEFDKILAYVEHGVGDKHTRWLVDTEGFRPMYLSEDEADAAYERYFK